MTKDDILAGITTLAECRNKFVAFVVKSNESIPSKIPLMSYAARINFNLPVLRREICTHLAKRYKEYATGALNMSPFSKPDAPFIKNHIDGVSYSKGEPPKNHALTRNARRRIQDISV